jgi:REP element-mobilizing transposase RayT
MPDRFRDKYRIPSARLQNWDYGWSAAYFVTICTAHRERYFGEIVAGLDNEQSTMQLSEIGKIAVSCWQEIPNHFPFVILDEYVVMPNHVHGIIIISKSDVLVETPNLGVSTNTNAVDLGIGKPKSTGGKNDKWESGILWVIINQISEHVPMLLNIRIPFREATKRVQFIKVRENYIRR